MVGYRNEVAFDGGEHTPLEILKFETVDLGNAWLLEQIPVRFSSKLQDDIHEFVIKVDLLHSTADNETTWEEENSLMNSLKNEYSNTLQAVLDEVGKYYGIKINYLLWLADLDIVIEEYLDEFDEVDNLNAYKTGSLIFRDLTGNLYAYEDKPTPINSPAIKKLQEFKKEQ